ncbi:hypothetical protein [Streptococcus ferus]|uniref:hypothetical protein n=1 Tax=Streptococcus ferus TaxID=1345 RepID=UPI002357B6C5|nr:hypothetical protein [Streptococcus ferus]
MAFESKKEKISKVLQENIKDPKPQRKRGRKAGRPSGKTKFPYQFTLKPQNREKLDRIAEASGYNTASTFLDDWIEGYKE